MLDTFELLSKYAVANLRYCPPDEPIPVHRSLSGDWQELVDSVVLFVRAAVGRGQAKDEHLPGPGRTSGQRLLEASRRNAIRF